MTGRIEFTLTGRVNGDAETTVAVSMWPDDAAQLASRILDDLEQLIRAQQETTDQEDTTA